MSCMLEPVSEDEEIPVRYFPQNFHAICTETGWANPLSPFSSLITKLTFLLRFSPKSMRRLYRGFKTDCPSGLVIKKDSENPQLAAGRGNVERDLVKNLPKRRSGLTTICLFIQILMRLQLIQSCILHQNFPASCVAYSHAIFSCLDRKNSGRVTFEVTLSLMSTWSMKKTGSIKKWAHPFFSAISHLHTFELKVKPHPMMDVTESKCTNNNENQFSWILKRSHFSVLPSSYLSHLLINRNMPVLMLS